MARLPGRRELFRRTSNLVRRSQHDPWLASCAPGVQSTYQSPTILEALGQSIAGRRNRCPSRPVETESSCSRGDNVSSLPELSEFRPDVRPGVRISDTARTPWKNVPPWSFGSRATEFRLRRNASTAEKGSLPVSLPRPPWTCNDCHAKIAGPYYPPPLNAGGGCSARFRMEDGMQRTTERVSPLASCRVQVLLLLVLLFETGCSLGPRVAARLAGGYLAAGATVFQEEPDPIFAEAAIPANYKLLEVLLARAPRDRKLNTLAAEYLATYAQAFLEPRIEMLRYEDPAASEQARVRASLFYQRGRAHGLRALERKHRFVKSLDGTLEELREGLETLGDRDLPALFWTAFCWGSYMNLHVADPLALADSGVVVEMMTRVLELNEAYYYGGAHLFFGAMLSQLPAEAGGDPEGSRRHFERAIELSHGRFLMARVFFARYYATRVQDRALWNEELERVLTADLDEWPEERLANTLAQTRARFYLEHEEDYFVE